MKTIVFKWSRGWNDTVEEEVEFDDDATEAEIGESFFDWVMQTVGEKCTWYEKEE